MRGACRWDAIQACISLNIWCELSTDGAECRREVVGAIRSLLNNRSLQPECTKVLHEALLMPVLLYGSKTMV